MNIQKIAKHYACPDSKKMKWEVQPGMAQCSGCSGNCGMGWPDSHGIPTMFAEDKNKIGQLELVLP